MACGERGWICTHSQREIPAAVPALTSRRCWFHVPNRRSARDFADSNAGNIGGHFRKHVDVNDDLTIVREIEIQRRAEEVRIASPCGGDGSEGRENDQEEGGEED